MRNNSMNSSSVQSSRSLWSGSETEHNYNHFWCRLLEWSLTPSGIVDDAIDSSIEIHCSLHHRLYSIQRKMSIVYKEAWEALSDLDLLFIGEVASDEMALSAVTVRVEFFFQRLSRCFSSRAENNFRALRHWLTNKQTNKHQLSIITWKLF